MYVSKKKIKLRNWIKDMIIKDAIFKINPIIFNKTKTGYYYDFVNA